MIIVMGLPGAGKSTVLKGLKTDYRILNYGDLMLEIEKEHFGVKDRDDMRKLPIEKQKKAQKMVYEKLAKEHGKVILDTHCSVSTPTGFFPGLPFDYLKLLKVDALVLVTADPKEVAERRATDPTRKRDDDDIFLHDSLNRGYLAAYSAFTGAPAVVIFNRQGKLEEAVAKLQAILI
ncbi:Adenylate kinase [Candidatus Bilamarchaeum dharawalense]|uniref:Adenylate kinase n=1 Tax=Candidatus Bilamarchaeum dharawalense TaxID=2885759 RepID=A0A5E4LQ44_9ARCH|nr:Adenylate kinase [Candidatus Bilamarchaeum dharawalense]